MDAFGRADARQVAVTLISENQAVGPQAFDGAGHGRSTPVGGFHPIHVYVIIGKNGTATGEMATVLFSIPISSMTSATNL